MMLWKQLAQRLKEGMHGNDLLPKTNRGPDPSVKKDKADSPKSSLKAPDNAHKTHYQSS